MLRSLWQAIIVVLCRAGWLALVLLAAAGCREAASKKTAAPPQPAAVRRTFEDDPRYVGSEACAECHAQLAQSYAATHSMAQAIAPAGQEKTVENYTQALFSPPGNRTYQVERTAQGLLHHEIMFDRQGEPIFDQVEKIAYIMGSGRRGRSYIIDRDGLLFQSPIGWYSQQGLWALSPGYRPEDHQRFDRRIRVACMFCHAGRMAVVDRGGDRFAESAIIEGAISCERCHGPGANHVAHHRAKADGPDDIVNPARLAPTARDSVCYQCHVRPFFIFDQPGRHATEFQLGDRYSDQWATFVPEGETGLTEQFQASQCFQKSAGKLGCISCHDPHYRPDAQARGEYYRHRCLKCHDQQGCALPSPEQNQPPANGSCVHCHMPAIPAHGIPHTSLVDHRIPRRPADHPVDSSPAETGPIPAPRLFLEHEMSSSAARRAHGLFLARQAVAKNDPAVALGAIRLLELDSLSVDDVLQRIGDDLPLLQELGIPFVLLNQPDVAVRAWQRALEIEPTNDDLLDSLARFYARAQQPQVSLRYFDLLIRENPHIAEYHWLRSQLLEQLGDPAGAIQAVSTAVEKDPTAIGARLWLVEALRRAGRIEESQQQQAIVNRMRRS